MNEDVRAWTATRLCGLLSLLLCLAPGCDPEDDDGDAGADPTDGHHDTEGHHDSDASDDSGGEGIAIAGTWIETYRGGMITHTIDDATWTQDDAEFGPFDLTVVSFDNATQTVIADDGAAFSKLQWAWTDGDTQLWYCTAAFGAASAEEAEAAADANPSDPAAGGCGEFAWSMLNAG